MAIKITSITVKLIRLANNNSNDNEANSAARRVCAELGKQLDAVEANKKRVPPPPPPNQGPFADIINDWFHERARGHAYEYYNTGTGTGWDYGAQPRIKRKLQVCQSCNKTKEVSNSVNEPWTCDECAERAKKAQEKFDATQHSQAFKCPKCKNPLFITLIEIMIRVPKVCPNCQFSYNKR